MKLTGAGLELSATDLANFIGCKHRTALDLQVAQKARQAAPRYEDPLLELLWKRGLEHERRYVEWLSGQVRTVTDLSAHDVDREIHVAKTIAAMRAGDEVIVQGALRMGSWFGKPDVLHKVSAQSDLGQWSYEVYDMKLSRSTKAGTVLQLGLYSEMLASIQGARPERFFVVTPRLAPDRELPEEVSRDVKGPDTMMVLEYRLNDYAAYMRLVRKQMEATVSQDPVVVAGANYPDPVSHCQICHWSSACNQKRRDDDHLSLIAGISRAQRQELQAQGIETLTECAKKWPLNKKVARGSMESFENVHRQASIQLRSREHGRMLHELRPVVAAQPAMDKEPATKDEGLCRLPEPSPGDVFLDLEGDAFATEGGREYLFGIVTGKRGKATYKGFWGFNDTDERASFEAVMDFIAARRSQYPDMHVYHYAPYEVTAFKKLRLRYGTRGDAMDAMLKAGTFVDLYAVVRQGLWVGTESYSIKRLEQLYGFTRTVQLDEADRCRRSLELALQSGETPESGTAETVRGYNEDDCVSTLLLRDWLEEVRASQSPTIPRPTPPAEKPDKVDKHSVRVRALRPQLIGNLPKDHRSWSQEQRARYLLAHLLDYHQREQLVADWEYYRLRDLETDKLKDEPRVITDMEFVTRLEEKKTKTGKPTGVVVDRYRFPQQEMEIDKGTLKLQDDKTFGSVAAVDRIAGTIDVTKRKDQRDNHPTTVFEHTRITAGAQEDSLFAIGQRVADAGLLTADAGVPDRAGRSLLLSLVPRLKKGTLATAKGDIVEHLTSAVLSLDHSVLPVQGPPGSGKTYAGAQAICALVAKGKKVGVAASGHRVIHNLLTAIADAAKERKDTISLAHKRDEDDVPDGDARVAMITDNDEARRVLDNGEAQVLGGTAWLWSRAEMASSVDVLVVDEAGQMALANVVAMSPASESIVLLGDPQQLDQPRKATHPDGVDISALDHMLNGHVTVPDDRGVFLPKTWRMSPPITAFTSEVFYEGRLSSIEGLEKQVVTGGGDLGGAGLRLVPAKHDSNKSYSDEEVTIVVDLVKRLSKKGVTWTFKDGKTTQVRGSDILIVAPYNAQVSRLNTALEGTGARVGTVDKFQGQEEPIVIYSMATSRPEDAPRGMEFLYSLNRLNVATSRARCVAIVVASPLLLEPECKTPRQMKLANALCRYRELAVMNG